MAVTATATTAPALSISSLTNGPIAHQHALSRSSSSSSSSYHHDLSYRHSTPPPQHPGWAVRCPTGLQAMDVDQDDRPSASARDGPRRSPRSAHASPPAAGGFEALAEAARVVTEEGADAGGGRGKERRLPGPAEGADHHNVRLPGIKSLFGIERADHLDSIPPIPVPAPEAPPFPSSSRTSDHDATPPSRPIAQPVHPARGPLTSPSKGKGRAPQEHAPPPYLPPGAHAQYHAVPPSPGAVYHQPLYLVSHTPRPQSGDAAAPPPQIYHPQQHVLIATSPGVPPSLVPLYSPAAVAAQPTHTYSRSDPFPLAAYAQPPPAHLISSAGVGVGVSTGPVSAPAQGWMYAPAPATAAGGEHWHHPPANPTGDVRENRFASDASSSSSRDGRKGKRRHTLDSSSTVPRQAQGDADPSSSAEWQMEVDAEAEAQGHQHQGTRRSFEAAKREQGASPEPPFFPQLPPVGGGGGPPFSFHPSPVAPTPTTAPASSSEFPRHQRTPSAEHRAAAQYHPFAGAGAGASAAGSPPFRGTPTASLKRPRTPMALSTIGEPARPPYAGQEGEGAPPPTSSSHPLQHSSSVPHLRETAPEQERERHRRGVGVCIGHAKSPSEGTVVLPPIHHLTAAAAAAVDAPTSVPARLVSPASRSSPLPDVAEDGHDEDQRERATDRRLPASRIDVGGGRARAHTFTFPAGAFSHSSPLSRRRRTEEGHRRSRSDVVLRTTAAAPYYHREQRYPPDLPALVGRSKSTSFSSTATGPESASSGSSFPPDAVGLDVSAGGGWYAAAAAAAGPWTAPGGVSTSAQGPSKSGPSPSVGGPGVRFQPTTTASSAPYPFSRDVPTGEHLGERSVHSSPGRHTFPLPGSSGASADLSAVSSPAVAAAAAATAPTTTIASGQSRYECSVCGKRFNRPSSLKIHHYSHTGEKPFHCEIPGCGRSFSVQSNLRRHQRVHSDQNVAATAALISAGGATTATLHGVAGRPDAAQTGVLIPVDPATAAAALAAAGRTPHAVVPVHHQAVWPVEVAPAPPRPPPPPPLGGTYAVMPPVPTTESVTLPPITSAVASSNQTRHRKTASGSSSSSTMGGLARQLRRMHPWEQDTNAPGYGPPHHHHHHHHRHLHHHQSASYPTANPYSTTPASSRPPASSGPRSQGSEADFGRSATVSLSPAPSHLSTDNAGRLAPGPYGTGAMPSAAGSSSYYSYYSDEERDEYESEKEGMGGEAGRARKARRREDGPRGVGRDADVPSSGSGSGSGSGESSAASSRRSSRVRRSSDEELAWRRRGDGGESEMMKVE